MIEFPGKGPEAALLDQGYTIAYQPNSPRLFLAQRNNLLKIGCSLEVNSSARAFRIPRSMIAVFIGPHFELRL